MSLWIIIALIFFLYLKTINYFYVIDDYNKRDVYPLIPTKKTEYTFFSTKPSVFYRLFMIGMHAVNASIIYMLWGWQAALIFAVHPMGVWGTAWVTGNYYATTAYFTLIAYYFFHTFPGWGLAPALLFYYTALHSTFDALTFPFIFLLTANIPGLAFFIPMIAFLNGKKFKNGLEDRVKMTRNNLINDHSIPPQRIAVMVKIVAKYIYSTLVPLRVFFFNQFMERCRDHQDVWDDAHAFNKQFWASLAVCVSVFVAGLFIHPFGIIWYFCFIGLHSQFNVLGQPFAQRYIYIALPGMVAVLGTLLAPYPMALMVVVGILGIRTWYAMQPWSNQESILMHEIAMNPTRGESYSTLAQHYIALRKMHEYDRAHVNFISYLIRKGAMLDPRSWQVRMNLAAYFGLIGDVDNCLQETKNTIPLVEATLKEKKHPLIDELHDQVRRYEEIRRQVILQNKIKKK